MRNMKVNTLIIFVVSFFLLLGCKDKRGVDELFDDVSKKIKKKEYVEARKDVEKLERKAFENSEVYRFKGIIEAKLGNFRSALLSFQKSLELDSLNYKAYVDRADLKITLGDYSSAINDCNVAYAMNSNYSLIHNIKGYAYERIGDDQNSIAQYKSLINKGGGTAETYFKIGVSCLNQGSNREGCYYLSKAGEMGYMEAYDLINRINNCDNTQYKRFINRLEIIFPSDWVQENLPLFDGESMWYAAVNKDGHRMVINEFDAPNENLNKTDNSIYNIDKEIFLESFRQEYKDLDLNEFRKVSINGHPAYYCLLSFTPLYTKDLKYIIMYVFLNSKNNKIYIFSANALESELDLYKSIYRKTIETIKLL